MAIRESRLDRGRLFGDKPDVQFLWTKRSKLKISIPVVFKSVWIYKVKGKEFTGFYDPANLQLFCFPPEKSSLAFTFFPERIGANESTGTTYGMEKNTKITKI